MKVTVRATGMLLVGVQNPGVIARDWNKLCYAALEEAAYDWWASAAPKHFDQYSRRLYPGAFFVRKPYTLMRKARKWGHSAPLVNYPIHQPPRNKQTIEGMMARPPIVRVTKRRKVVKATWPAPPVSSKYKDEAVAMNDADVARVGRVLQGSISRGLRGATWRRASVRRGVPLKHTGPQRRRARRRIV